MLRSLYLRPSRNRRGIAIMIAISILAILTMIAFGLAASVDFSGQAGRQAAIRHDLQRNAWFGLDTAKALLAKTPNEILETSKTLTLDNGSCVIAAQPAKAEDTCYSNSAFKLRPSDTIVSVSVTVQIKKDESQTKQFRYLLNIAPGTERVVPLPPVAQHL